MMSVMRKSILKVGLAGIVFLLCCMRMATAFDIQTVTSPKGLTAWLVQSSHAPIVTLKFSMPGGAGLDPKGKEGVAVMMADMLTEGAGDLDSEAFKFAVTELSSGLSINASGDYLNGTVNCLKENCAQTFAFLKLALTSPRFEERDFQRVLQQQVQSLEQRETDQENIGYEAWSTLAFAGHHYGRPNSGTAKGVVGLMIADLQAAFERQISRRKLVVSAVGDISSAELAQALDSIFAELPDTEVAAFPVVGVNQTMPQTQIIDYEGPQSVVYFGAHGLLEDTPDRVAAYVMGELLGGGATFARLNQELREKSGLTYGVSFGHSVSVYAAQMLGSFSTAKKTAKKALEVLDLELARFAKDGPTEEELHKIKSNIHGSFVLRLTNNDSIAALLLSLRQDGRGTDFAEKRKARIDAVTVEDVKRVAALLLAPEKRILVVVGRPE
jgi:zinc protease